ncbi:hypothetical protein CALCODRAFT_500328 [Calocera cornea HHB12733]|uniref:Uncharacterized protein n=1 Tax=Calocera cornea HHB12733 TaxID=1353952 RepID=A0A165E4T4_9BASI|nr:hypothetical protein CALCODRAFT_500328 [Calocera cornea HHB12733]
MELFASYTFNMPDMGASFGEPLEHAIENNLVAVVETDDTTGLVSDDTPPTVACGSPLPLPAVTKPTKRIPTITFPAAAFYIDPQMCLPTPVDDKYPILIETGAYMLPQSTIDPRLSLLTPTKDKDDGMGKTQSPQISVDPAVEAFTPSSAPVSSPTLSLMAGSMATPASMLQLSEPAPSMSRDSSDFASSASTVVDAAIFRSDPSKPYQYSRLTLLEYTASQLATALGTPTTMPLPAGFPTHLPVSFPARTGIAVLNARSQPMGWDCGPATISLFEAKYGPGSNGPLSRDVDPGISGGAPKISVNWRLYGDGRLGAESSRQLIKAETTDPELLRVPSPLARTIAEPKQSSSRRPPFARYEPPVQQARAIWMQYYAAVEHFRTLRLPSVMGPWEPDCRCPFSAEA